MRLRRFISGIGGVALVAAFFVSASAQIPGTGGGGSSVLTPGTTTITGGTNGKVEYNNNGVLGEQTLTQTAPTNVQRFTALASLTTAGTPVCAANACQIGGSGYGATATGTLTLISGVGGFTCATPPVINVTTNAGGNIITINSITTAGSCTAMGAMQNATYTAGGGLSAGSAVIIPLTWTATGQTYTPTANMKYAMVYPYGGGGQGGGGASTISTTASSGGGGGGGGSLVSCLLSAAQVSGSQTVTVGLGGRSGGLPSAIATGPGTIGQAGGNTTFGSTLCKGWGGGGGFNGVNAATIAGGGAGGGMASIGANGASGGGGAALTGGGPGGTTFGGIAVTFGGGAGGGGSSIAGVSSVGGSAVGGGAGGSAGGGVTTVPGNNIGSNGGAGAALGFNIPGGAFGAANTNGTTGTNPVTSGPNWECGSAGGGGGSGLTTTVGGNGGPGAMCSGGGGGGSVVNGAASAPGFGGPGGDGVADVVEFF